MPDSETHARSEPTSPQTTLRSESAGKIGFGVDQPTAIIQLVVAAGIIIATGFIVAFSVFRAKPDLGVVFLFGMPVGGALILAVAASVYWSSRLGKPREVERVIKDVPWGGSEVVVDVGCGRGLMMIDAAERLDNGIAVGADLWKSQDLSGNDPASIWANARAKHVLDRVAVVKADARHLPFADSSVDVGMSSMTINILGGRADRRAAIRELVRIVKGGGRIAVIDGGKGSEYSDALQDEGVVDLHLARLRFRSFPPLHSVTGRKPFSE